jgi:hypothetical protein
MLKGETGAIQVVDCERKGDIDIYGLTIVEDSNSVSVKPAAKKHGNYGMELKWSGSSAINHIYQNIGEQSEVYFRMYIKILSDFVIAKDEFIEICSLNTDNTGLGDALITALLYQGNYSIGLLFLNGSWDSDSSPDSDTFYELDRDVWYMLEIRFKKDYPGGSQFWLDNELMYSDLGKSPTDSIYYVVVGNVNGTDVPNADSIIYVDDIVVNDEKVGPYAVNQSGNKMIFLED